MSTRLSGHVAMVTGAANGIGRAFAIKLAAEGAAVAVVDIADSSGTVAAITAGGGKCAPFLADISDPEQVAALVAPIEEALGTVDILVNNAGIYPRIGFTDLTFAEWRRIFAVNVESMFLTVQTFSPAMRAQGWGRIVNMASDSVGLPIPGITHYISSKMAVIGLTRGIATEFAGFGITANVIAPSVVRTPGTTHYQEEEFGAVAQMQAIKRPGIPEDLTGALVFLVSDDSSFVTGQTLYVDGGLLRSS